MMKFRRMDAEYQLAYYSADGAKYDKHRDAMPDDGTEVEQRRVTCILYTAADWAPSHGGALRAWIPKVRLDDCFRGCASAEQICMIYILSDGHCVCVCLKQ